jgi:2-dehydro-3-deoxyphosphogluconate aldolase/(4S)-4-hydroxy-2-oxoglutarate aldolase
MNIKDYIEKYKIICICRKLYGEDLMKLAHALYDGGIRMIEVTYDQNDPECTSKTVDAIADLCGEFGDEMRFGAGTVLNKDQVDAAKSAGAEYIISPNTNVEVIKYTKACGLVSIPGAMTPSDILTAHDSGADFVKLFPATWLGFPYIKDILGPITHVKLIATGGVKEENLQQYIDMGFAGAGISGRLTNKKLIENGNFAEITKRSSNFMSIINNIK